MIILVDFENTHASGLEGYTYLNESDTLVMYYSDENSAVTKGVVDDLRKNGVHVRLVKLLKQHSNALDMYIASTTGMFLDSGEKICIVSKDHGYAAVRDFWHSLRGAEILLGETIKECLLSSELNDEARIRLCKEREQKAMLVDAFTTMNTIPTRPTLSRSNQRRRRNDTRNFMEVSEPVAILPNPLVSETPADQLAKELSSAVAKYESEQRASKSVSETQQKINVTDERRVQSQEDIAIVTMTTDNAPATTAVLNGDEFASGSRNDRNARNGRNGRNRRNDQNERNDRRNRNVQNTQDREHVNAAQALNGEQRTANKPDSKPQNLRNELEKTKDRRNTNVMSPADGSDTTQERFGGYDGITKVNEASRIALGQRQEREEQKAELSEASREMSPQSTPGAENAEVQKSASQESPKKETTALIKTEQKTAAIAKVDPNRVQFVWDPVSRSMKRVGAPTSEKSVEKTEETAVPTADTSVAENAKTSAQKKNRKSLAAKKETTASKKPSMPAVEADASKTEADNIAKATVETQETGAEKQHPVSDTAQVMTAKENSSNKEKKPEKKTAAKKTVTKKSSTKKVKEKKADETEEKKPSMKKKKAAASSEEVKDAVVDAKTADAKAEVTLSEEDIQLAKKKYSDGINTLHTYYVRLMKVFGRDQGRRIYEETKKSVQEDIKARKAQLVVQDTVQTAANETPSEATFESAETAAETNAE